VGPPWLSSEDVRDDSPRQRSAAATLKHGETAEPLDQLSSNHTMKDRDDCCWASGLDVDFSQRLVFTDDDDDDDSKTRSVCTAGSECIILLY